MTCGRFACEAAAYCVQPFNCDIWRKPMKDIESGRWDWFGFAQLDMLPPKTVKPKDERCDAIDPVHFYFWLGKDAE